MYIDRGVSTGTLTFENVTFSENYCYTGCAFNIDTGNRGIIFRNSHFLNNVALEDSSIANVINSKCKVKSEDCEPTSMIIESCLFIGNHAINNRAGLFFVFHSGYELEVNNSTFKDNYIENNKLEKGVL